METMEKATNRKNIGNTYERVGYYVYEYYLTDDYEEKEKLMLDWYKYILSSDWREYEVFCNFEENVFMCDLEAYNIISNIPIGKLIELYYLNRELIRLEHRESAAS